MKEIPYRELFGMLYVSFPYHFSSIVPFRHRLFTRRGKFCLSYVYDVIFTTSTAYENFNVNELAISCQSSCHGKS